MKIAVVIPTLHRGGAERVVSILTQEWSKEHAVKLITFDSANPAYLFGGDLIDFRLPASTGVFGKLWRAIQRVVRLAHYCYQEKPDRIISFMEAANYPAILAALLTGNLSKLCVSVRNDPDRFPRSYLAIMPFFYRLPARVVAVSEGVAQALIRLGVPATRLLIIPNPVSYNAPSLTRNLLRLNEMPERYILGMGRLHKQKGFDRLIDAFVIKAKEDPELTLIILGEGQERLALEQRAIELGMADRVKLPGAVDDVWPWYRFAQCFVLSSYHEGWPNVIMEAISQGCPVVAFNCKYGPNEIIEEGWNGYLVEEGNIEALSGYINNIQALTRIRMNLLANHNKPLYKHNTLSVVKQWLE